MTTAMGTLADVRLRDVREQQRLSQVELAAKAGVTPSTVSKLERIKGHRPQARVARLLAAALGVSPDDIDELRESYRPTGTPLPGDP